MGLSIKSKPYRWWYYVYSIAICGGSFIQYVHIFHIVLLALQPVAASMKQGEQF